MPLKHTLWRYELYNDVMVVEMKLIWKFVSLLVV